jgi:ethanolamine permease
MIAGSLLGLGVMLVIWFVNGGGGGGATQLGDDLIGTVLLNMAVFGAMLSYIAQALSFILLRRNQPNIERPFRSPLGIPGAAVTILIAVVTLYYQMLDPNFFRGVIWVIVWCAVGIVYFALFGRNKLILSPEEEFAMEHAKK